MLTNLNDFNLSNLEYFENEGPYKSINWTEFKSAICPFGLKYSFDTFNPIKLTVNHIFNFISHFKLTLTHLKSARLIFIHCLRNDFEYLNFKCDR